MDIKKVLKLIDRHITMNEVLAVESKMNGDESMVDSHLGAVTGLTMLKKEINKKINER